MHFLIHLLIRNEFITHAMKPFYTSVLAILATVTIVGMMTIGAQHVFAPRTCAGCAEFQKLSDVFEKNVFDTAAKNDTAGIQKLLDEYSSNVMDLFKSSPSP